MPEYSPEIDKVLTTMPYFRQLYGNEAMLGVSTTDNYIFYERGARLNLGIRPGDPVKEGSISGAGIKAGHRVAKRVPRDVWGVPFMGISVPILEDGKVVGAIALGLPIDGEEQLEQMAVNMNSSVDAVSQGSAGFAASAEELAATSAELATNTEKIQDDLKGLDEIISLIMEIASQTHLLGLNAAIEAARAGDMGRGFNVVAEEIRKLAGRTHSSAKEVTQKLTKIKNNIGTLAQHVLQVSAVSQEQAATSEEIASGIRNLEPMARDLLQISAALVR